METERDITAFLESFEAEVTKPVNRPEAINKALARLDGNYSQALDAAVNYYIQIQQTLKTARGTIKITSDKVLKDWGFIHETKEGVSITLPERLEGCEVALTINYLENGGKTAYYTAFDNQANKAYVRKLA